MPSAYSPGEILAGLNNYPELAECAYYALGVPVWREFLADGGVPTSPPLPRDTTPTSPTDPDAPGT